MHLSEFICYRRYAISLVLGHDQPLYNFFFDPDGKDLNFPSESLLLRNAREHFEVEKILLLQICLDIWQAKPRVKLAALTSSLAEWEFDGVVDGLRMLRQSGGCHCDICRGRLTGSQAEWKSPNIFPV